MPRLPNRGELALVILVLIVCLFAAIKSNRHKDAIIAMKPTVVEHEVIKTVQGPTKVVEKIVYQPGGERVIERVITDEGWTTARETEHKEEPVKIVERPRNRFIVGLALDPIEYKQPPLIGYVGYSLFKDVDVIYGYAHKGVGGTKHMVGAIWRFW